MSDNPYEILGVSKEASEEEIKTAYRTLVRQYHPDVSEDPDAEDKIKNINYAYEILSDPEKRRTYDTGPPVFGGLEDFLRTHFGPFGAHFRFDNRPQEMPKPGGRKGQDIYVAVGVHPLDVMLGKTIAARYTKLVPCDVCDGRGSDLSKCGTCNGLGSLIRQVNQGNSFMQVSSPCYSCMGTGWVKENACTNCEGNGLIPKTREERISLEGLSNNINGVKKIVPGAGNYGSHRGTAGDLIIEIVAIYPEKITPEVRELLEKAWELK